MDLSTSISNNSALQIVYELVKSYTERGVALYFVHLRSKQLKAFERVGLTDLVSFIIVVNNRAVRRIEISLIVEQLDHTHFTPDLRSAMHNIEQAGSFRTSNQ